MTHFSLESLIAARAQLGRVAISSLLCLGLLASCAKKEVKSDEGLNASAAATDKSAADTASGDSTTLKKAYFDFDRFTLSSDARNALKANADWLKRDPAAAVQIEGHCDERGTTEYNLALGERRANAVKAYLANLGVEGSRISTISYGNERPEDPGHTEEAWAKNRRAVSVIVSK